MERISILHFSISIAFIPSTEINNYDNIFHNIIIIIIITIIIITIIIISTIIIIFFFFFLVPIENGAQL